MDRNHFKNVISDYFIIEKLIFLGNFEKNAWKHWFFQKKVLKMTQKVSILFRLDPFLLKSSGFVPAKSIFFFEKPQKFRFCSGFLWLKPAPAPA